MLTAWELDTPITILKLATSDAGCKWEKAKLSYAKAELKGAKNIYSPLAQASPSWELTVRTQDISCADSVMLGGDVSKLDTMRLLITDVQKTDSRHFIKVTAAMVLPVRVTREIIKTELNELNNPVRLPPETQTLEGWLTERYQKNSGNGPMAELEAGYVLIIPKAAKVIPVGDIIRIDGVPYAVRCAYLLNPSRNEYEVVFKGDA